MRAGARRCSTICCSRWTARKVNLRQIPHTTALLEQKLEVGAAPSRTWWLNVLRNGALPGDTEGKGRAPSAVLFDDYIEHARAKGVQRRVIETSLGMFLKKQCRICVETSGITMLLTLTGSVLASADWFTASRRWRNAGRILRPC